MATAKKTAKKTAAKSTPVEAPIAYVEAVNAIPRSRGPRGTTEDAGIRLAGDGNPKREGSKAHAVYSHYEDGMTIADFCAALEATNPDMVKEATPNLVYDCKHGFITIDGYEVPGGVVVKEAKEPKAPKVAKEPKAPKKSKADPVADAAVEAEAQDEVID